MLILAQSENIWGDIFKARILFSESSVRGGVTPEQNKGRMCAKKYGYIYIIDVQLKLTRLVLLFLPSLQQLI